MLKWFKKFIDRLAEVNEDTFKGKKLDCCDLNKQDVGVKKTVK